MQETRSPQRTVCFEGIEVCKTALFLGLVGCLNLLEKLAIQFRDGTWKWSIVQLGCYGLSSSNDVFDKITRRLMFAGLPANLRNQQEGQAGNGIGLGSGSWRIHDGRTHVFGKFHLKSINCGAG